jgi:glucan-binding YG repeat protein
VAADAVVGNTVSAVGLSYYNPDGACLRVRDRAEIELVSAGIDEPDPIVEATLVKKYGKYYLVAANGEKLTGFQTVDGTLRFFDEKTGVMAVSKWVNYDGKKFRALADGRIAKNEIVTVYGSDYYLDNVGALVTSTIFELDGNKYYAKADGKISKKSLLTIGEDVYISLEDGKLARNIKVEKYFSEYIMGDDCRAIKGFIDFGGKRYYGKDNGRIAKDYMFKVDGDTYYAKKDGTLAVSETITRYFKKYTFDENGKLVP